MPYPDKIVESLIVLLKSILECPPYDHDCEADTYPICGFCKEPADRPWGNNIEDDPLPKHQQHTDDCPITQIKELLKTLS